MRCCISCAYYVLLMKDEQLTHILDVMQCMPDTAASLTSQQTQNIGITFMQCWNNVEDVGPTLYTCYTNVLCLLEFNYTSKVFVWG